MTINENMQVVVLMGGLGSRLKEITQNTPKPMIDIYGKPFFYYQLELMKWYGLKNFIFLIGYKGSVVEEYFKDGKEFGVNIKYSYDGDKLLGTAGAIRKALPLLDDDFMVIYGDSFMDVDYKEIINNYYSMKFKDNKKALMTVFKNNNSYDKSNAIFKDRSLINYDKKKTLPQMEYIDYGISLLNRCVIEEIPQGEFIDLADVYTGLVNVKLMEGYEVRNRFYEIGTPTSLSEFNDYIFNRIYTSKPAIFLDRDGTLNEIVFNEDTESLDSPLRPEQLKLLPKTIDALKILKSLCYTIIIVTNQPAAAKGKVSLTGLFDINNKLRDILAEDGVYVDDILMCTHFPSSKDRNSNNLLIKDCDCRKPKPGLIRKATEKFNINLDDSFMVGDSHVDVLSGTSLNIKTVFLGKYKCDMCQLLGDTKPTYTFKSLYDFACFLKDIKDNLEVRK